ncbi:hypothetical protein KOI35_18360 [Actinoplanes bogorensis]|uniref:LppX_LprAFG lipoprotein n=1 Tax=Paractinoplanes bogorensis TaxID=1610840 RepID=A0ABS5YPU4_9ACTN|nr:hypothetical protein [Actinoplanes bogorensis]MBU2665474.1 hypothetical protein [Actinoplanes bogorensis]
MKRFGPALLAVALLAGCGVPAVAVRAVPAGGGGSAAPKATTPAETPAIEVFQAALRKTHNATYKYSVSSALPDKYGKVSGTGVFDLKSKKLKLDLKYSGGTYPHDLEAVMIGKDAWHKSEYSSRWVHLDMSRLKEYAPEKMDMTDPVGLATFTKALKTVRKTGPLSYAGTFDPNPADSEEFLPLGAPSIRVFSIMGPDSKFTATTDANGFVTVVNATVIADETVKMTTKFSAHGKPSGIKKPSRTVEAADFYYE